MKGHQSQDKAYWIKRNVAYFLCICIIIVDNGMTLNTYFDKNKWKYMMNTFKEMTDPSFTKSQLKNKYDGIKKNWRV
jgi:hypothetical protein